jgi:hypothetical protein
MFFQVDERRGIVGGFAGLGRVGHIARRGVRSLATVQLPEPEPMVDWTVPEVPQCWPADIDCNERARLAAAVRLGRDAYVREYNAYLQSFANWRRNYLDNPAMGLTLLDRPAAPNPALFQNWTDASHDYYPDSPDIARVDGGPIRYTSDPLPPGSRTPTVASLALVNLTRTGSDRAFYPGDAWRVTIRNARPNSIVSVTGGRGSERPTTPMGSTDALGSFAIEGRMTSNDIGDWWENWAVAGQSVGVVMFDVLAAPAGTMTTGGGNVETPAGNTTVTTTPGGTISTPAVITGSTNPTTDNPVSSVAGSLPGWAIPAGVGVLVLLMMTGRR